MGWLRYGAVTAMLLIGNLPLAAQDKGRACFEVCVTTRLTVQCPKLKQRRPPPGGWECKSEKKCIKTRTVCAPTLPPRDALSRPLPGPSRKGSPDSTSR
jgi:hypothetical protein